MNDRPASFEDEEESFVGKTAKKIFANLQLTISNVHMRYQGEGVSPFAFGVTLDQLVVDTVDCNRLPCKARLDADFLYKLASLHRFAVYWNSFSPSPVLSTTADMIAFLEGQVIASVFTLVLIVY